jgi:hypothetical protein
MGRKSIFILVVILSIMVTSSLLYAKPMNYTTHLAGETAAVETLGQGQVKLQVSDDGLSVHYRLIVANIRNVTMAHIHIADIPGGTGGVAVWLYPSMPPPAQIPGRTQGVLGHGMFTAANLMGPLSGMSIADLVTAIHEGRAYVNVHTSAFPGGEIRGYLR